MASARTAVAIREHLRAVRGDTTQGVLRALEDRGLPVSLASVRKTLWMLLRLKLIYRVVSSPTGPGRFERPTYALTPSKREDRRWNNPSGALWPRPKAPKRPKKARGKARKGRGRGRARRAR